MAPRGAGLYQVPINGESGLVAEGLELFCCFFNFHGNNLQSVVQIVNDYSRSIEV